MSKSTKLRLGCTVARHKQLGVHAVINARAGLQHLNDMSIDDWALYRDGQAIKARVESRISWYGPHSKFFRRHRARIEHLIARHDD